MASATLVSLVGFIIWSLLLLVLMESIRSKLVLTSEMTPDGFDIENSTCSPFMQRLARVHANCIEGLPIFGGLMLVALVSDNTAITDPLAYIFLAARIVQSVIHLISISSTAILMRFTAFAIQMAIGLFWSYSLVIAFI